MGATVGAIFTTIKSFALTAGEFVGNTLVAAGVPTNVAAAAATATVYTVDAAIYLAPTLAAVTLRPDVPTPESARIPLRTSRPVRFTGTGRARISGAYMLFEASDVYSYDVFALHDGRVDAFEQWWLNDDAVTVVSNVVQAIGRKYKNECAELQWRSGLATETPYSDITTALGTDIWPSTARGDGIASVYLYCDAPDPENFLARFPNGLPTVLVTARLSRIFDPRDAAHDPDDADTWEWTDNPVLGLLFYLCFFEGGPQLSYSRVIAPRLAWWKRAADICDELVPQKAGGTAKRYAHGGGWTWDTAPAAVIGRYLDCFDGWMAQDGDGCLVIHAGKVYPPAVVLRAEHILGYSIERGRRREAGVAPLTISYSSPDHKYNMVQTDPWPSREALAVAGDEDTEALQLTWVQNNSQARRLAKRAYVRRSGRVSGSLTVDLFPDDGTNILGERYLRVLADDPFPPSLRDLLIEVQDIEMDVLAGTAVITFVKADPEMDAWDAASEEGDGPSTPGAVEGVDLSAPTIVDAEYEAYVVGETTLHRFLVTVNDDHPDASSWLIRYRIDGEVTWTIIGATKTDLGSTLELRSIAITTGFVYEVQVAFYTGGFALSEYSDDPPSTIDMTGL